jgi:16S rRNA processing protein RimM
MTAEGGRRLTVAESRPNRGRLLVRFNEVDDRSAAETLAGQYLFVPASALPELPEGSFWPHELIGCEVVTEAERLLGRISQVIHGEANDIWVVLMDGEETLVPALKDVVVSVDTATRRVVIREVAGLTQA